MTVGLDGKKRLTCSEDAAWTCCWNVGPPSALLVDVLSLMVQEIGVEECDDGSSTRLLPLAVGWLDVPPLAKSNWMYLPHVLQETSFNSVPCSNCLPSPPWMSYCSNGIVDPVLEFSVASTRRWMLGRSASGPWSAPSLSGTNEDSDGSPSPNFRFRGSFPLQTENHYNLSTQDQL